MAEKKEVSPLKKRFEEKAKKSGKKDVISEDKRKDFIQQIATREILEREFAKDTMLVTFDLNKDTRVTVEAKKPSPKEVIEIMKFSIRASRYEGKTDAKSLEEMVGIYEELPKIAAEYSLDPKMDEKWWNEKAKFEGMINYVMSLILASQQGSGGVHDRQIESFRSK